MLPNFLIGLREGLEAALIVGILVGYLVRTGRRDLLPNIWAGVGLAIAVSLGVGAALTFGTQSLTFQAQEAIGGILSIVAAALVTVMIFWMARNARRLRHDLQESVDQAAGYRLGLMLVAFLAVAREGLETALFLWAAARVAGGGPVPLVGALLGLAVAALLGWAIYRGMLRINLAKFFTWTGAFLILIAAGVLAYGVHDLQEAGILPGLDNLAYDVSHVLAPGSIVGTVLKGSLNISPSASVAEAAVWLTYVIVVGFAYWRTVTRRPAAAPPTGTAAPASVAG